MLPAAEDNVVTDVSKRRRNRRRQGKKVVLDDASRLQKKARYLLIKIKLEQNLIEAYSGEGWKGQSREKIRPEKELQRAYKQILKCKLGIRDAIRQLELLGSVGSIEDSVIAPDGSVHHEHIICAKCKLREAFPDNDIILCDGICNCAFHQKCLDPPLPTDNIPPEDQGWFCKFCQCRMEIIDVMNAHLGTQISAGSSWQDIFSEEASVVDEADDPLNNAVVEWPSDDSDDDDYDPEKNECSCSASLVEAEDSSSLIRSDSVSISWSYEEEEAFSDLREPQCSSMPPETNSACFNSCADSPGTTPDMTVVGCRQRRTVDYRKLYFEMFGKDAPGNEQVSEDEDWGPGKRKRKEKESYAASTLMTLFSSEKTDPNETIEVKEEHHRGSHTKRPFCRIPPDAVEKLRQVFAEDELPSKSVRENLSKSLGLSSEKVNKWFKNARYLALRNRKLESSPGFPNSNRTCSNESMLNMQCDENKVSCTGTLKEDSLSTLHHTSIIKQGGYRVSLSSNLRKKKRHRKALLEFSSNSKKVIMEFGEDVSLKQQLQLLKSSSKNKIWRYADFKEGFHRQATGVEMEMERLCTIKSKVDNMLENLTVILKHKTGIPKADAQHEQAVIHFPIAEVREKFASI